jgi:Bacteriophage tail sheath protein
MPVAVTYPGVYVDELPSAVRTIIGVSTSITAFVGSAARGPVIQHTPITSWERVLPHQERPLPLGLE